MDDQHRTGGQRRVIIFIGIIGHIACADHIQSLAFQIIGRLLRNPIYVGSVDHQHTRPFLLDQLGLVAGCHRSQAAAPENFIHQCADLIRERPQDICG